MASSYTVPLKSLPPGPARWYEEQIASGEITADDHQREAVALLQGVHEELSVLYGRHVTTKPTRKPPEERPIEKSAGGMFGRLFGSSGKPTSSNVVPRRESASLSGDGPRGVYLWGGVGCGKSMLMDAFFDNSAVPPSKRRRVHFNSFMLEVHRRVHRYRADKREGDALLAVASAMASEAQLLCFDEFQVTDVGDAMLMHRLFGRLFDRGVTMVATSNRPPQDLYANGLQRELFQPCIARIVSRCAVHHLGSAVDYRLAGSLAGEAWIHGNEDERRASLEATWRRLVGHAPSGSVGAKTAPTSVWTQGREVHIPRSAVSADGSDVVCCFSFHELCATAKGAADYIAIAEAFDAVVVSDVPSLTLSERNELRRLITLVDVLYEAKRRLYVTAERPMKEIFEPRYRSGTSFDNGESERAAALAEEETEETHEARAGFGVAAASASGSGGSGFSASSAAKHADEAFAFDRCISRLIEMGSREYLGDSAIGEPADRA